jgi:chorismate mutase
MTHDLQDLRKSIDIIDDAILLLLSERFRVTQKVGELKRDNNLPEIDKTRESQQFAKLRQRALEANLDPVFIEKTWGLIIDTVVKNHKTLKDQGTKTK